MGENELDASRGWSHCQDTERGPCDDSSCSASWWASLLSHWLALCEELLQGAGVRSSGEAAGWDARVPHWNTWA